MNASTKEVYEYAKAHLHDPICALALPIPDQVGKYEHYDIEGRIIPVTWSCEEVEKVLVPYDVARAAVDHYEDVGAEVAYFYSGKWLVISRSVYGEVVDRFKPFCPFADTKQPEVRFPVEAMPEPFRAYIEAVAESYQVDTAMVACCVLANLSAIFQQIGFRATVSPDWIEPTNLYIIVVAPPSEKKSPVLNDTTAPIMEAKDAWNQENETKIAWQQKMIEVLKKKVDNISTRLSKGDKKVTETDLKSAQEELMEAEKDQLRPQQWLVDDTTPEALAVVLRDNKETAALLSGEGGSILGILAGRYSAPGSGANIDIFLKGYSVEPAIIHRIGRQSITLKHPRMTVLLMAQPSLLQDFVSNDSFSGRGLCARFLYSFPLSKVGSREFYTEAVPKEIRQAYETLARKLMEYALEWTPEETTLTFSKEALDVLAKFHYEIEPTRREMSDSMQAWSGKHEGNCVRIAALLYLAQHEGVAGEIDADTMRNAVLIGRYFQSMAEYAFGYSQDSKARKDALYLLQKMTGIMFEESRKVGCISRRELFLKVRGGRFKSVSDLDNGLRELTDNGYIVQYDANEGKAGRPSPTIVFNPEAFPDVPRGF